MKKRRLLILGAGGHGRVVADCASLLSDWSSIAFCDRSWPHNKFVDDWPIIGGENEFFLSNNVDVVCFVGIGKSRVRLEMVQRLQAQGRMLASIIHPAATVSRRASLGECCLVAAGAVVNTGANVAHGCIINTGAVIDHDCRLADGVHVSPGAYLSGNVSVGQASWIGTGSAVRQGVNIGRNCTVGVGAAVVNDVQDGVTVVGVPACPIDEVSS